MAYLGNSPSSQAFTPAIDYFSGNGVAVTFTLSRPVASVAQIICAIDNVIQNSTSAYTVAGNSITFTSAPLSGTNNIWVQYTSLITTYAGISQDPSVIGDITATGGFLATGDFGNTYTDGTIVDYVTGNARITTGPADGLTIYNGGPNARNALLSLNTVGSLGVGTSPSYGTTGQTLVSSGTGAAPTWGSSLVSGTAVASTSGTSIDFTGIPSWAKRVTVILSGVSTNSSNTFLIQIGSGSISTTGYLSAGGTVNGASIAGQANTSGIAFWGVGAASSAHYGNIVLTTVGSNSWISSWTIGQGTSTLASFGGGGITLSGALDRVRITTGGGDIFDAGSINILWE